MHAAVKDLAVNFDSASDDPGLRVIGGSKKLNISRDGVGFPFGDFTSSNIEKRNRRDVKCSVSVS